MNDTITLEDVWKAFLETDRKMREMQALSEETDRQMREIFAATARQQQETDRQIRQASAETDRKIKEVSRQVGNLGSRWGEFVEGIVAPA
ncbi:MAG: hypothetical protein HQL95_14525, partial [Magnetococcales bacterium]|nr:hypothetical protein [Magnetococcales bacterium]